MTANVPLCDLQAQYRPLQAEIEQAVCRLLASGQVVLGPEVAAFEREVSEYCGASYAVGCGSGTDAISLALCGLNIGAGDEVIIPTFTFFATAGCIVRLGATPIFCDIDPVTFNIDPADVARKITQRTKAIMPVHLFGQCADMEPLWDIAAKYELPIVEDAAQAFGAEYRGKKAGTLGGIACYSFYPTKNLGTYGDAGMSVTSDPEWAERMVTYRVHGMKPKYYHKVVGWMARIDALHAAILRVKLRHVDTWLDQRRAAAKQYDRLIAEAGLDRFLARPTEAPGCRHTFNQYVVRVADGQRDAVVRHMQAEKIGCEIYYPLSLHQQECLLKYGHRAGDFPIAEAAARCVLALPMYPEIAPEQQARVVGSIAAFRRQMAGVRRAA